MSESKTNWLKHQLFNKIFIFHKILFEKTALTFTGWAFACFSCCKLCLIVCEYTGLLVRLDNPWCRDRRHIWATFVFLTLTEAIICLFCTYACERTCLRASACVCVRACVHVSAYVHVWFITTLNTSIEKHQNISVISLIIQWLIGIFRYKVLAWKFFFGG